ncbi:uncharacterized protein T069G_11372 [Trichoderma breve]|uniref:DUF7580 domain-containing protein n=1 Tax=Trichoderma breve TaxID=2034170 RepID=A0A9W9B2E2_9HYPO|nr:uncharacterized protein T069G_11372 [Trichoderma breve]KAJ4854393.1 hypothetical protein T069G_11372 [Trichoderma breve]
MAEAVGLALSVLPIVIWALEKYSEPLEAYTGYHNAISTLQANLQIQRMHLEATFQSIGLRHPTPRELHECLRQKFPQNHREILFIIRQMDDMMMKLMENLQVDMGRRPLWTHESSERASWEWRRVKRSFRAKKCDKIIHDLRNWNDDLRHLIESAATLPHDESYAMRRVRRLYNRSNCESVRNTLRSLHRALQAGLDSDGAKSHQVCIELNSLHAGGIPLLTFRIASVEDTSIIPNISEIIAPTPPPITNLCKDFDSSPHEDVFGSLKDPTPTSSHEQTIFSLSHVSRNHDRILRDISLEKIIATESQRVAPAIQPLSAKRRYGIAASLAWAVLYLSGSPWLSHGLDRRKVKLFLQRKQANGYISLSEKVYLSCIISKTSFPSPASSSTSLGQTTPKNLIFELGILLIELAVNRSFSQESLSAILQHDYRPLKHYLDRVELEAGIYYFNAAQRCVYSVFLADQEQMDFDLDKFQHEFYSTVVAPLQATYEAR